MKKGFALLILLVLFATSFCGCAKKVAATVNDEKIYLSEVEKELEVLKAKHAELFKGAKGKEYEKTFKKNILDSMIEKELGIQEAKKQGIRVSEKEVESRYNQMKKMFPSTKSFEEALKKAGLTPSKFKVRLREQLLMDKIWTKVTKGIEVSEEEMAEYYEKNKNRFKEPEKVKTRHILLGSEKEAKDILKKLKDGEDFGELAKKYSMDKATKDQGGSLDWMAREQLAPEFADAAFRLNPGEISDVVKTQYGFHIIKLEEKKTEHQKSFEEVKDQAKQELLRERQTKKYQAWVKKLRKKAKIKIYI
ncbi:MAG: peptidylprolyl isomerase [Actinomycetota bacterium]|nr:peptidylprolyl isomerase [Actinomycetota bacterium]MDI6822581.1 peptidylprolyl isomerase [Actinomycetota bacterium]